MQSICQQIGIDIPIAKYIYDILWQQASASDVFREMEKMLS
jgi:glycerol-3-phosphate dehydrogenase